MVMYRTHDSFMRGDARRPAPMPGLDGPMPPFTRDGGRHV